MDIVAIILMALHGYFINGFGYYFINDYWWFFIHDY
jgi:hypothetical protein